MSVAVLVSSLLTIVLFFILHFIVTPRSELRKARTEQLIELYAPLYGLLLARIEVGARISPDEFTLGNIKEHEYLEKKKFDKMIFDKLGYASIELIYIWSKYTTSTGKIDRVTQIELTKVITKDFNSLRKKLKLPYDKAELRTGIPKNVNKEKFEHS